MKTCIFTIIFQHTHLEEAIMKISEIGYEGVELMCRPPHLTDETPMKEVEKLKKVLDYYHLPVVNLATYTGGYSTLGDKECQDQLEKLKHYIKIAEILECPMVRHWDGGPSMRVAQEYHVQKAVYWFKKAADIAARSNKKLTIEIHNNGLVETPESSLRFVKLVNHANVGLIFDPGNMYITDCDYGTKSVEMLFPYIYHVHVKDELRVNDATLPRTFKDYNFHGEEIFQHTLLGEGGSDHLPSFKQLVKMGYQGYVSTECHAMPNDVDTARHELDELKKLIKLAEYGQ